MLCFHDFQHVRVIHRHNQANNIYDKKEEKKQ